jgi:hypothetical protein
MPVSEDAASPSPLRLAGCFRRGLGGVCLRDEGGHVRGARQVHKGLDARKVVGNEVGQVAHVLGRGFRLVFGTFHVELVQALGVFGRFLFVLVRLELFEHVGRQSALLLLARLFPSALEPFHEAGRRIVALFAGLFERRKIEMHGQRAVSTAPRAIGAFQIHAGRASLRTIEIVGAVGPDVPSEHVTSLI